MSQIKHGRRKGQPMSAPEQRQVDVNEMPMQADIRKVTILSKNDWNRIQYQLNRKQIEAEKIRQKKAEEEAKINSCKEIVKNWTNTLAGQRQKKLEARKIRLEKEEEEKKAIDIEEAKYQAQKRKEAIEKAKTQQYYQSDRVKQFHGALLLTEVLKEREAQLELAHLKEKHVEGKDREWVELQQREHEEAIRQDQMEAAKRNRDRQDNALFQTAQIKTHIKQNEEEMKNDRIEGDELQRLAIQHHMEKQRLEVIRRDERQHLMNDNVKQIADVERMKEIQKLQEEEEDEECNIFARAKRKMMKLRAEKERQLHNEKQERLEKIRGKLGAQMQEKLDDEDERILRAVEESEVKRFREDADNQGKQNAMRSSISKHRIEQLKQQEEQEKGNHLKELEMLAVRKEADRIFRANEEEKRKRKLEEDRKLMGFHFKQVDEVKDMERKAHENELAQAKVNMGLIELEERQFQEYATKVIDHCDKGGRKTYALKKAAREGAGGGLGPIFPGKGGIRPSYMVQDRSGVQMPHYQRDTTEETKKGIYGDGRTNKRLGFVW